MCVVVSLPPSCCPVINNKMENVDQLPPPPLSSSGQTPDNSDGRTDKRSALTDLSWCFTAERRTPLVQCERRSVSQSASTEDGSQQGEDRENKANFKTEMIMMMMNQRTR